MDWNRTKRRALQPDFITPIPNTKAVRDNRTPFLFGAQALGLTSRGKSIQPQQCLVNDLLGLRKRFTAILMPRRSTKTTIILAWLIGRCLTEPDLMCAYGMMTSQKKARQRYLSDVVKPLERAFPDAETRPFKLYKGNGTEWIKFNNGSELYFYGPSEDAFRSDAFDVIVLDEAGEIEGEKAADILGAALPTQDTRPGAMLIYAGTAGRTQRGNMLWDALQDAQSDNPRSAGIAYWADQSTLLEEVSGWEPTEEFPNGHARELVELHHPGVGTMTTIQSVQDNYDHMKPEVFMREYLGIFSDPTGGNSLLDMDRWAKQARPEGVDGLLPERFALAIAVDVNQRYAAIVAVWRNDEGKACFLVLDARKGYGWLADRAYGLSRKYRAPIIHDDKGPVMGEVEWLQNQSPKPQLVKYSWGQIQTSAAVLVKTINASDFYHWNQPDLTDAARDVVKRMSGPKAWGLGKRDPEDNITPIEAASIGLNYYDKALSRKKAVAFIL